MGSKEQDWEGTVLSKLGKGSGIVLFQKVFLLMSNIYQRYPSERHFFGGGQGSVRVEWRGAVFRY